MLYQKYSAYSDVWSYGCVLYEIWSIGHTPFEDVNGIGVCTQCIDMMVNCVINLSVYTYMYSGFEENIMWRSSATTPWMPQSYLSVDDPLLVSWYL